MIFNGVCRRSVRHSTAMNDSLRNRRSSAALLALLTSMTLAACSRGTPPAPAASPAPARTVTAQTGTIAQVRDLGGFIAPAANVSVSSSLAEPAAEVDVVEGQRVLAGQTLAVLDVSDMQAEYEADVHAASEASANASKQRYSGAQTIGTGVSNVANARSTLIQAREKERLDRINLARDADLLRQQYISQQTYDSQLTTVREDAASTRSDVAALNTARITVATNGTQSSGLQGASLDALDEAAAQARATARQIAASVARATIVTPVSGIVTNRNLNPGEYPGSRTLFTIQALDTVYAQLNASSEQTVGVALGEGVAVRVHGSRQTVVGRVAALLGQAAPGSTNFTIKVRIDNRSGTLLAGTAVYGSIDLPPVRGTRIPRAALDADETQVGIVRNGTYHTSAVRVIAEDANDAIVSGVTPGTSVVTESLDLHDGERVAVR